MPVTCIAIVCNACYAGIAICFKVCLRPGVCKINVSSLSAGPWSRMHIDHVGSVHRHCSHGVRHCSDGAKGYTHRIEMAITTKLTRIPYQPEDQMALSSKACMYWAFRYVSCATY